MQLIIKMPGKWQLYNPRTQTATPLEPEQIKVIQELCAEDLREELMFDAIKIEPISPNKLQQLTTSSIQKPKPKKSNPS